MSKLSNPVFHTTKRSDQIDLVDHEGIVIGKN